MTKSKVIEHADGYIEAHKMAEIYEKAIFEQEISKVNAAQAEREDERQSEDATRLLKKMLSSKLEARMKKVEWWVDEVMHKVDDYAWECAMRGYCEEKDKYYGGYAVVVNPTNNPEWDKIEDIDELPILGGKKK